MEKRGACSESLCTAEAVLGSSSQTGEEKISDEPQLIDQDCEAYCVMECCRIDGLLNYRIRVQRLAKSGIPELTRCFRRNSHDPAAIVRA